MSAHKLLNNLTHNWLLHCTLANALSEQNASRTPLSKQLQRLLRRRIHGEQDTPSEWSIMPRHILMHAAIKIIRCLLGIRSLARH